MKRTVATYLKIILSVLLVLTSTSLCGYRLLKIQVVDSASYATRAASTYTYPVEKLWMHRATPLLKIKWDTT